MIAIDEFNQIYKVIKLRKPTYTGVEIEFSPYKNLMNIAATIRKDLGENINHENILLLDYEIKKFLFSYGTEPLVFSLEHEQELRHYIQKLKGICEKYLGTWNTYSNIEQYINYILKLSYHPYNKALKEIIKYTSRKYVIVTKKPLQEKVESKIADFYPHHLLEFITFRDFTRDIKMYDNVIFLGTPSLFSIDSFQYLNADNFYFIYFNCFYGRLEYVPWIESPRVKNIDKDFIWNIQTVKIPSIKKLPIETSSTEKTFLVEDEFPELLVPLLIGRERDLQQSMLPCRLIELEEGGFIFEDVGEKAKCDVLNSEYIYARKHINEINTNDFIISMDFNRWEDRKRLADQYFEDKGIKDDRKRLEKFKKYLSQLLMKYGPDEYTNYINKRLNLNLKTYQLVGLTKKETFKLQNNNDFLKLLEFFTKSKSEALKFKKVSDNLTKYHNQLGRQVRSELRKELKNNPEITEQLESKGYMYIPQLEMFKVNIYKVKRISSKVYQVPLSRVGTLIYFNREEVEGDCE